MCEVCEKIDFAIETLDSLFPANELIDMWNRNSKVAASVMASSESSEVVETSAKANFICLLVARYAVKQGFAPHEFENILNYMLSTEYFMETQAKIIEHMTGKRPDLRHPKEDKLDDYKS